MVNKDTVFGFQVKLAGPKNKFTYSKLQKKLIKRR